MQGNSGFSKIIRTRPLSAPVKQAAPSGKQWQRTDKRAQFMPQESR